MSIDSYLVGREILTREEEFIFRMVKLVGKPIGEHEFHTMMRIASSPIGDEASYQFIIKHWEDIDERYRSGQGSLPYCERLHEMIESLVGKYYLIRDSENPIVISEDRQLRLF